MNVRKSSPAFIDLTMEVDELPGANVTRPLEEGSVAVKPEPQPEAEAVQSIEVGHLPDQVQSEIEDALPSNTEQDPSEGLDIEADLAGMLNEFIANSRAGRATSTDNEYDDALQAVEQKRTEIATKESLGEPVDEACISLKFLEGILYQAEKRENKARDYEIRRTEENAMFFPEDAIDEEDIPMTQAPSRNEALGTPNQEYRLEVSDDDLDHGRTPGSTKRGKKATRGRNRNVRKTPAVRGKTGVQKRTPAARQGGKGARGNTGMGSLNMGSLMHNPIVEDAQRNQGLREQPTFAGKSTKKSALTALIASIPKEHQDTTYGMKAKLDKACRRFGWRGPGSMKPDPSGRFRLKGMTCSLKHFQLFGAAWGVERESGPSPPFGGVLADTMGYGKVIQLTSMRIAL